MGKGIQENRTNKKVGIASLISGKNRLMPKQARRDNVGPRYPLKEQSTERI